MHPVERLRYVVLVGGAPASALAREVAVALAEVADEAPAGLLPACRGLLERFPAYGPLWWICARLLTSADPVDSARESASALATDPTALQLVRCLPEEGPVLLIGWPEVVGEALERRGDLEVLVAEGGGEGAPLARRLADGDRDVAPVPDAGVAAAASVAGLVLLEATAAGPGGVLAAPGSHAAAAVAARSGVPVWAVTPVGTVVPAPLWDRVLAGADGSGLEPWDRESELVVADLLSAVVGPDGLVDTATGLATSSCPVAAELLRPAG